MISPMENEQCSDTNNPPADMSRQKQRQDPADDGDAYEVKRSQPRRGDSYVGGLDILTIHEQIGEPSSQQDRSQ